jgi:riboflavin biosynthesis pyrimidine reductase
MITIPEILDQLAIQAQEREREDASRNRPYVLLNMASTADGRASIGGRAGPIGDSADSELLHGLRTVVGGLLVGAQTVRAEHYARVLRDDQERKARKRRGLRPELEIFIVSRRLDLSPREVPLLGERDARVTIVTPSSSEVPPCPANPAHMRCDRDGTLDFALALRRMRDEHGIGTLLCEGGPHLAAQLVSAGLIDELFVSIAPKLAGGEERLRILAGAEIDPPAQMRLLAIYEHDSSLFLRYRLGGG